MMWSVTQSLRTPYQTPACGICHYDRPSEESE
jgi:hypothetical protein